MEGSFIPECYFDTVLVKTILQIKGVLNHKKGCNDVIKVMKDGKLKDNFAVGIVDKDKTELGYLKEFDKYEFENLNLYRHSNRSKHHYIIQLNPPIEKWILRVAREANINIVDFGLPEDFESLKKLTKSELAAETQELKKLCKVLVESESATIKRFANWVKYLKEKNYNVDINELKNA